MTSTFTPNKNLEEPAHNDYVDTWQIPLNNDFSAIDLAFGGATTLNANGLSGTQTLNVSAYLPLGFIITGTPSGNLTYQVPSGVGGFWVARNRTSGASITIGFSSAAGGSTVNIPQGTNVPITADGTALGMVPILTATGAAAGSNGQIQFNSFGNLSASANLAWDGLTFSTTGLNISGNTVLGSAAGSILTVNGTAVATPNGLNINSGLFQFGLTGGIGIGIAPTGALLAVGGSIQSTSGGYTFPDASVQTTAIAQAQIVKAWITFNGISAAVLSSNNVTSLVKNSTGQFTVNFTTPFATTTYGITGITNSPNDIVSGSPLTLGSATVNTATAGGGFSNNAYVSVFFVGN